MKPTSAFCGIMAKDCCKESLQTSPSLQKKQVVWENIEDVDMKNISYVAS